ncbi:imm11 family protein [Myxococcus faecalis]|uniref:imm11 family protein n=1 Tax=Myxococcus faecalis TaxID=3115646 RepID=UPI003CED9D04
MERRFFDLSSDEYVKGRWYLGDPVRLDGGEVEDVWRFSDGVPVELSERLRVPVRTPGTALDIEFAGVGLVPIVSSRVASVFRELAPHDVQLFPVEVEGTSETWFLLNVARQLRCIDDEASEEVQLRTAEDHEDRIGEYGSVIGLRIDKSKVGAEKVFRLWGWRVPLIVDEEVKDALEANGIQGGRFDEV